MKTTGLPVAFGLRISGIDLQEITAEGQERIRQLLAISGLLIFKRQSLSDEQILGLSRLIGNGQLEQSARCISVSSNTPFIVNLTNLRDAAGHALGYGGDHTDYWHSDQEFRERPASLGLLYCALPCPEGGQTSFASTRADLMSLSPEQLARLAPMRSTRRPAVSHDNAPQVEVAHDVVMRNPVTGLDSIYVSENLRAFIDCKRDSGEALKRQLMERVLDAANIYRHRWEAGDLILYDNTQLVHRREAFSGPRWMKAAKIYPVASHFAVPVGTVLHVLE